MAAVEAISGVVVHSIVPDSSILVSVVKIPESMYHCSKLVHELS